MTCPRCGLDLGFSLTTCTISKKLPIKQILIILKFGGRFCATAEAHFCLQNMWWWSPKGENPLMA